VAKSSIVPTDGTFAVSPIQAGMNLPHFPTYCNFMLANADDGSDYTTAIGFLMLSTGGVATTYGAATTQTGNTPAITGASIITSTSTSTSLLPTTVTPSPSPLQSSQVSALATTKRPAPTDSPSTAVASDSHATGLSSGAKAGVAIGVILAVLALFALAFLFIRRRRNAKGAKNMATLRSTSPSVDGAQSEKTAVNPSLAPSPGPMSEVSTPRVAVFKIGEAEGHRNSEEWRRFFGNAKTQRSVTGSQD
jgi:hypothetical protein